MMQIHSAGFKQTLSTTPEYRHRYQRALNLFDEHPIRKLRASTMLLKREYDSWRNAQQRDGLDPSIASFKDFIRVHGPMPDDTTKWSLDRINPLGPYAPPNIRWLDPLGQTRNRTNTLKLRFYGHDIHLNDVALVLGIPYRAAYKVFSRDPCELVSRMESASYRLQYQFPSDFAEELEATYAKNVHGLMRLHWMLEYGQQDVMRLADEVTERPDDSNIWLQHQNALSVLLHAIAFDKWAEHQLSRKIEFQRDLRSAGPLPPWELENIHFESTPPPEYQHFANRRSLHTRHCLSMNGIG